MVNPLIDPNAQRFFGAAPAKPKSELNMQTFLRLLTVQLANQNPMEPMNDRDFFAQMAQLGQVQGNEQMQKQLQTLQASSLIGKTVKALVTRAEGTPPEEVVGRVVGMDVKNGKQILKVAEQNGGLVDVEFNNIQGFTDVQTVQPPVPTLSDASMLIGREVTFTRANGNQSEQVAGRVVRAVMQNGQPMVVVDTEAGETLTVRYSDVREVRS